VQITWSASTGATYYQIFRNTSNDSSSATSLSSNHSSSPYNDTSAVAGTTYYYWVKACNSAGCSGFSASDSGYRQVTTPPTNPFLNPGFEEGATVWTQSSSNEYPLIVPSADTSFSAHGGSWIAWLGGDNDEVSLLSQTITISASAPYLHFWYRIVSEDGCGYDFFDVAVNDNTIYTLDLCNNTYSWTQTVLDLSAYTGVSKTVRFSVNTDVSGISHLFLDDVSMSASAVTANTQPVGTELYPGAISRSK